MLTFERVLVLRWNVCGIGLRNDNSGCAAGGTTPGRICQSRKTRQGGRRGYVPKRRSPKSPRPGRMYLRSLSARSSAAVKMTASGTTASRWADPFRGGHDREQPHLARAQPHEAVDGHGRRAAGGQHGVEQEHDRVPELARDLLVVAACHRRLLVALEAEVADLGPRGRARGTRRACRGPRAARAPRPRATPIAEDRAPSRGGSRPWSRRGRGRGWPPRPAAGSRGGPAAGTRRTGVVAVAQPRQRVLDHGMADDVQRHGARRG